MLGHWILLVKKIARGCTQRMSAWWCCVHFRVSKVLTIKQTRCTNFSNLFFGIKLYMFRTVPPSIIRSFSLYTQQWYMSYRYADSLRANCQQTCMTYTIAACTVKNSWWWMEELSETCRVLSQKNKFEKLVHLVGFIIRIYHDARLPECQKPFPKYHVLK